MTVELPTGVGSDRIHLPIAGEATVIEIPDDQTTIDLTTIDRAIIDLMAIDRHRTADDRGSDDGFPDVIIVVCIR